MARLIASCIIISTEFRRNGTLSGRTRNSLIMPTMIIGPPPFVMNRSITSTLLSQWGRYATISAAVKLPDGKGMFQLGLSSPKAFAIERRLMLTIDG